MRTHCSNSTRFLAASALLLGCVVSLSTSSAGVLHAQTGSPTASSATSSQLVTTRLTQPIDDKALVPLKGTMHPLAIASNDRGAVDSGMQLERVQILLSRSTAQETALKQAIRDMHTPGTASYHKWLTPDEFGKLYGPSDADIATLSNWLGTHGFAVTKVNPGRMTLEMTGSAAQFQSAFHASIHKYNVNGQMHYANSAEPQIPAALAPVFGGFASLNNFPLKSQSQKLGTATFDPATHATKPNWTTGSSTAGLSFPLAPGDFAVQYDLNPLYTAGVKGTGQTIGIINETNIDPTLVAQYRTLFGLPASAVNVIIDGNDPGIDGINNPGGPNGASGEAYLDIEIAGSVAPSAQIDLVIAGDTALANGLGLAAEHAVYANVAPVLSLSFGGCESNQGTSGNAFWSQLWEQAAAQGQTVMVSTGDSGSAGCDSPNSEEYAVSGQAVNGLASTPYNVAVGGTDFYYSDYANPASDSYASLKALWNLTPSNATPVTSLMSKVTEQPWNDSQFGLNYSNYYNNSGNTATSIAGAGGGASNCAITSTTSTTGCAGYAKPAWQTGTGVPADGVRDIPDLSLFAANGANFTYYPICASDGDCQAPATGGTVQITGIGGTSASTPAFAGLMALVNQQYGRQGQADFVLYKLAAQYPTAFNDVVHGTNTVPCSFAAGSLDSVNCIAAATPITITDPNTHASVVEGQIGTGTTPEYNAVAGYDLATGLGTIDANVMVSNWNKVTFATSSVTLSPSQTNFAHGTSVNITGAVTPSTATGAVSLETTSTLPLQAAETVFTLSGGNFSGAVNYLPGGTYSISGAYGGDGTNGPSTSTPVSITVTPEASSLVFNPLNTAFSTSKQAAFQAGASIPYGTQVELSGQPVPTTYYNTCVNVTTVPSSCSTTSFGTPTGTVTFADGGQTLNAALLNAQGDAEYNAGFAIGTHSVTASYSGDASYNASTAAALSFTVVKDTPDIYLTSGSSTASPLSVTTGSALIVNVENSANDNSINTYHTYFYSPVSAPTGVVTITGLGSSTITLPALVSSVDSSLAVASGSATIAIPTGVTAGAYTATVSYPGDANYAAFSKTFSVTVVASAASVSTTTTATASPTTTSAASPAVVTATVTAASGTPTGSVSLTASGVQLGSVTLPAGTGTSVTVTVALNSTTLQQGVNVVTVQYVPTTGSVFQASFATVTVTNSSTSAVPALALTNSGAISIAAPGGSGTSTITVTPSGGFTGAVTLTCAVSPTNETATPTCTVTSPVNLTGTAAGTATLTVNTTAASAALEMPKLRLLPIGGGAAMAAMLFLVLPAKRRRMRTLLGALVLMVGIGFSAGCGGGSKTTTTPPAGTGGTTLGTYTVTVSATGAGITTPATTTVATTIQ